MSGEVFEGKSVEEALEKAAAALGVTLDELEHGEAEEKTGDFWGLGEKVYRVRAWVPGTKADEEPAAAPEAPDSAQADTDTTDTNTETAPVAAEREPAAEEPAAEAVADMPAFFSPDAAEAPSAGVEAEPAADTAPAAPAEPEPVARARPETAEAVAGKEETAAPVAPPVAPARAVDDLEEAAVDLLNKIFDAMDFDCTADARIDGDALLVAITGDDNHYLLDGRGRGLSALEMILNHAFRHRTGGERKKIRVDAGDFRSQQEDEIRDLAYQVSHQAKETGTVQETQPLNPYERRIVHLTLADDPRVTTRSQGTGFLKVVSVIPKQGGRR